MLNTLKEVVEKGKNLPESTKCFLTTFIFSMILTVAYAVYANDWGHNIHTFADSKSFGRLFWGTVFSLFFSTITALKEAGKF